MPGTTPRSPSHLPCLQSSPDSCPIQAWLLCLPLPLGPGRAFQPSGRPYPMSAFIPCLFCLLTSWQVQRQTGCASVNTVDLIFVVVSPLILLQVFRCTVILSLSSRVFTPLFQFLTYFEIISSRLFHLTVGQIETQTSLVAQQ